MAVNPMLNSGSVGVSQGLKALENVAAEVAEFNHGSSTESGDAKGPAPATEDVTQAMVDLKLYQRQVQASANVIETADEVIGFLLDVRA